MGFERIEWRPVVDRDKRRDLQNGKGANRPSECHFPRKRQRLGRHLSRPAQRNMGIFYWPTKSSRRSGSSQKARRNVPLKSRFSCDPEVRCRISALRLIDTEEIEIALDRAACSRDDFEWLEPGESHLQTGAIFAVLNDGVVQLQFLLCCMHFIGASAKEIKLAQRTEFPVVIWLIHQGWFWKDSLQTQFIVDKPGDTTTGGDNRILELAPAET